MTGVQTCALPIWAVATALWCIIFFVIAYLDTPSSVPGLEEYPKPVLVNTTLGTMGAHLLWSVFWYGTSCLGVSLLISAAGAGLKKKHRLPAILSGIAVFSICTMLLCYFETAYLRGTVVREDSLLNRRMNILEKNISWPREIPDRMLPMYDEDFRKKILEKRSGK